MADHILYHPWQMCEGSAHPHLGLFALHDCHTGVGGSQVNANDCALHSFWPTKHTHIIIIIIIDVSNRFLLECS